MCVFCKGNKTLHHSKKNGNYTISSEISIVDNKLVTEISAHRYTTMDRFYDSFGDIDIDGEFSEQKFVDMIKYCPFCGKLFS